MVDSSTGTDLYGASLDIVAGDDWTVTLTLSNGTGHEVAEAVQQVLGGALFRSQKG
ncbi:hypothetical protein [Nonomuraea lactucae]|uniref:hypothetical protein n=1 Tax=Nonomuraea lactucae TaxID=2249762 RepID=UPI0013B3E8AA|nr:hypothetical protein [Nonomuraea lactucae]